LEIRYARQVLLRSSDLFRLFETTGWNRAYQLSEAELFAAAGKAGFYQRNGFCRRPEDAPGMEIKRC